MLKIPKDIEYIITDFDGVMTDGFVYIPNSSEDFIKRVNFKDVMGISIATKNGYKVGIISGDSGNVINYIQNKFNLEEVHTNIRKKLDVLKDIIERNNLTPEKIIYIGDDINDIDALNYVGYPITVNNAIEKIKTLKNIQITQNDGGNGAFREVIDTLIQ